MVSSFKKSRKSRFNIGKKVLLSASLAILVFLIFTNFKVWRERIKLENYRDFLENNVSELEVRNRELKKNTLQARSPEYFERIAREQLNYKGIGEEVVIVKKDDATKEVADTDSNDHSQQWTDWLDWIKKIFK